MSSIKDKITNFIEQRFSGESNAWSANQAISRVLCKTKVLYGSQNSPPAVLTVNQISPVHTPACFLKIHFKIIPIYAYVFQVIISFGSRTKTL